MSAFTETLPWPRFASSFHMSIVRILVQPLEIALRLSDAQIGMLQGVASDITHAKYELSLNSVRIAPN